jgi:hypothetical protein
MALDPATVTGFAYGEAGAIPKSGSVRLKRPNQGPEVAAFNMLAFLRDRFVLDRPDLCVIEHYMNPAAQKSADAVILQIMVFGVIVAMCKANNVRIETPHAATIRKHFCGAARAGARADTKRMVIRRAVMLGYVPKDCTDDNRCDAVAAWSWAECAFARIQPKSLVLFGGN